MLFDLIERRACSPQIRFNHDDFWNMFYVSEFKDIVQFVDNEAYRYRITMPGFTRDEIDIKEEKGIVTVTGEHKDEKFGDVKISRSFYLPDTYEKCDAKLKDGFLYLDFYRSEKDKFKKIEIN